MFGSLNPVSFQTTLIAGAAAFLLGGVAGAKIGHARGEASAAGDMKDLRTACERVETRLVTERDQARGELSKVNAATAAQVEALAKAVKADSVRRDQAAAANAKLAARAAEQSRAATETLLYAREKIQHAIDECTRAGVPADFVRVLNDLAATASLDSDRAVSGNAPAESP